MNRLGDAALVLSLVSSAAGIAAILLGGDRPLARRVTFGAVSGLVVGAAVAACALLVALVSRDFSNLYVHEHTSRDLSLVYTLTAFWAGNGGSLLLWLVLLVLFTALTAADIRCRHAAGSMTPVAILLAVCGFFALLMLVPAGANPFAMRAAGEAVPADGLGMNPILVNPGMVLHPLALYLGYVALAVPFALLYGGLLDGRPWQEWLPSARNWVLFAWLLLTLGNVIGAWWAYVTLGWGGYWGWDPVENASLMPWLTSSALLHSIAAAQRRGMFRTWTTVLAALTFALTIFGTLITRSNLVGSVHSFGDTSLGPLLLGFLVVVVVFAVAVPTVRWDRLRGAHTVEHATSREAGFLGANALLLLLAGLVMWGVLSPVVREVLGGERTTLGAEFYNRVVPPAGLLLLLLLAVCPALVWNRTPGRNLLRGTVMPAASAALVFAVLALSGVIHLYGALSLALCTAVVVAAVQAMVGDARAGRTAASGRVRTLGGLVRANGRRYGGFLVHVGLAVLLAAVTMSYALKLESPEQVVDRGSALVLGEYTFTYEGLSTSSLPGKTVATAQVSVSQGSRPVAELRPLREVYAASGQVWTRVSIESSPTRDLYVALLDHTDDGSQVLLRADVNPGVLWLWIGGGIMAAGGLVALWPRKTRSVEPLSRGAAV